MYLLAPVWYFLLFWTFLWSFLPTQRFRFKFIFAAEWGEGYILTLTEKKLLWLVMLVGLLSKDCWAVGNSSACRGGGSPPWPSLLFCRFRILWWYSAYFFELLCCLLPCWVLPRCLTLPLGGNCVKNCKAKFEPSSYEKSWASSLMWWYMVVFYLFVGLLVVLRPVLNRFKGNSSVEVLI